MYIYIIYSILVYCIYSIFITFTFIVLFRMNSAWSLATFHLTLFRMGFFRAAHGWGGGAFLPPLLKICHTYLTMIKLGTVIPYLRKIQKCINHVTHPFKSADISIFYRKSVNFAT